MSTDTTAGIALFDDEEVLYEAKPGWTAYPYTLLASIVTLIGLIGIVGLF